MRHLADQPAHRVARQPRVGVERDDVADAGGHDAGGCAVDVDERRVGRAAQQPVQLVQLAALALPADPPSFAFVPDPPAMQQQEAVAAGRRAVAPIEPRDALRRRGEQRRVALDVLGRGIGPVGEQREMKVAFRAREMVDLQPLDLLLDRRRASSAASAPRRACADAPARRRASSKAGRSVAPKPRVTPRLTSATAASMAGIAPRPASRPSHAPCSPTAASASNGEARITAAAIATAPT